MVLSSEGGSESTSWWARSWKGSDISLKSSLFPGQTSNICLVFELKYYPPSSCLVPR